MASFITIERQMLEEPCPLFSTSCRQTWRDAAKAPFVKFFASQSTVEPLVMEARQLVKIIVREIFCCELGPPPWRTTSPQAMSRVVMVFEEPQNVFGTEAAVLAVRFLRSSNTSGCGTNSPRLVEGDADPMDWPCDAPNLLSEIIKEGMEDYDVMTFVYHVGK